MSVARAKFRCIEAKRSVARAAWGPPTPVDQLHLTFQACIGEGNEGWSKFTPSGQLTMNITNPALLDSFDAGKDYYLDITEAA